MATEEKQSILPPYPELIVEAITSLDNKDGSSEKVISDYIESKYKDLPAGHSTLLAHHLNKMKDNGELEFADNNYKKADLGIPKKRGRGRLPKPKEPTAAGAPPSSPRPRGRPPKPKEPVPEGEPLSSTSPTPKSKEPTSEGKPPTSPRPRGRPPKPKDPLAVAEAKPSTGTPKKRGRPPKNAKGSSAKKAKPASKKAAVSAPVTTDAGVKRGRGRPPKAKPEVAIENAE